MRRQPGLTFIALTLLGGSIALAQPGDPKQADALFLEGRALMKKGDFAHACPKLVKSHELDPAPGTLVNLGDCFEGLGKLVEALRAYRDALAMLPIKDDRLPLVKGQIGALERRLARLTIRVAPHSPAGATVVLDGKEVTRDRLDTAMPVNPGKHVIVFRVSGTSSSESEFVLQEGETRVLTVVRGRLQEVGAGDAWTTLPAVPPRTRRTACGCRAGTAEAAPWAAMAAFVGALCLRRKRITVGRARCTAARTSAP